MKSKKTTNLKKTKAKKSSKIKKTAKHTNTKIVIENAHILDDLGHVPETNLDQQKGDDSRTIELESSVDNSFFYMNDKAIEREDNDIIINEIHKQYSDFNDQTTDKNLRVLFLTILDNDDFMNYILKKYDMNIFDFFKVIFTRFASLFNALFINKVKDLIKNKSYARFRKHNYR